MTSLGEYRVGVDFNPSGDERVKAIKEKAAAFIDYCHAQQELVPVTHGEIARLWALAMTDMEVAAMHAVKAATKKPWSL